MPNHETHLRRIAAILLAASCLSASAKDLGVSGTLWPIDEVDMRQLITQDAAKVDWDRVNGELKESAKDFPSTLRPTVTGRATETKVRYMDPSITLDDDIEITQKQPDGSYAMVPFHKKGTRVNPLEHLRPLRALLFIDANDSAQLQLAKAVLAGNGLYFTVLTTNGTDIANKAKELDIPLFYAYPQIVSRFQVTKVPSLVHPGFDAQRNMISITELAEPYDPKRVLSSWPRGQQGAGIATPTNSGGRK